jgi:HNH endonuclease
MSRKPISQKLRFEVFKRDAFQCQYCGASAPDVLLHVDHLHPVVAGGTNDILNLITSCVECNFGKGKTPLSDGSALVKQRQQLEELNEKRNQLELMIQWKQELANLHDESLTQVAEFWSKVVPGYSLNENGRRSLKKVMRQFSISELMDAMQTAADQSPDDFARGDNVQRTPESFSAERMRQYVRI